PDKNYQGLSIKITINQDTFIIEDNCGGIPYEIARDYAFRFGRSISTPSIKGSVGQFGIGMKRALFKMGRKFEVKSKSKRSSFTLSVDVEEWEKSPDNWNFTFNELNVLRENNPDFSDDELGTIITVIELSNDVKDRFKLENFIAELKEEIELEHLANIDRGLKISINGIDLDTHQLLIINSDKFKPSYWEHTFPNGLKVKAVVGVSERDLKYGGWYLFCNERMVLGPEQTGVSGWGARQPGQIPKYHGQYDRFRGYVYFDANDTLLLPWNTSKNNMDVDSPTYRFVRQQMITMMRPVIDFLNKLHTESSKPEPEEKPLQVSLDHSSTATIPVSRLFEQKTTLPQTFIYPTPTTQTRKPQDITISYIRPDQKVERAKKVLGVTSAKEVGERTFDYFYENECEE
ncbi:MAG: ATP-binding protein, partial [Chloroflexota bacterium]